MTLFDKKGNEILRYHGFSVTGKYGERNFTKSEIISKQYAANAPLAKYYKGVSIDTWDGSNFCVPENTFQILVSQKGVDALLKCKGINIRLERLSEMETSIHNVR